MDRISLNPKDPGVRGQEIRLHALELAVKAAPSMGRMDGPLGVAREFESWILGAGLPAAPAASAPARVETQEPAAEPQEPGDDTDRIDVKEPEPAQQVPAIPASVRQAAKK